MSAILIPLANGAQDIIVALESSSKLDGIFMALASLGGAYLFGASVILAMIVHFCKDKSLKVNKVTMYWDLTIYLLAILFVLVGGLCRSFTFYHLLFLLAVYVANLCVVLFVFKK